MRIPCYGRLDADEREVISREVRRNQGRTSDRAFAARPMARRRAASRRHGQRNILATPALQRYIHARLRAKWSPVQVAKRLAALYPADRAMQIAPETIYASIYVLPRGRLKHVLVAGLRQERVWRRVHRPADTPDRRGRIADMLSIEERPAEVAAALRLSLTYDQGRASMGGPDKPSAGIPQRRNLLN